MKSLFQRLKTIATLVNYECKSFIKLNPGLPATCHFLLKKKSFYLLQRFLGNFYFINKVKCKASNEGKNGIRTKKNGGRTKKTKSKASVFLFFFVCFFNFALCACLKLKVDLFGSRTKKEA